MSVHILSNIEGKMERGGLKGSNFLCKCDMFRKRCATEVITVLSVLYDLYNR